MLLFQPSFSSDKIDFFSIVSFCISDTQFRMCFFGLRELEFMVRQWPWSIVTFLTIISPRYFSLNSLYNDDALPVNDSNKNQLVPAEFLTNFWNICPFLFPFTVPFFPFVVPWHIWYTRHVFMGRNFQPEPAALVQTAPCGSENPWVLTSATECE